MVLAGAPGVGKSRLAREALGSFERAGRPTRWLQATRSGASIPFGAFARLLPEFDAPHPAQLLRLGVDAVRALSGGQRLILAVDDAHLLDPASAALVLELASSESAFLVLTLRTGEPCPDAIVSVTKDAGATRLELGPLAREQTEALVEQIAGGPVEQSARRWIHDTSTGNALYVRELTLGALAGGALTKVHGLWRMARRPPVSASLVEVVTARMTGLPDAEQRALEVVALGEPLRVSELLSLAGEGPVTELERRGLIAVDGASTRAEVTLAHPLYGETIRTGLTALRVRQVTLALAALMRSRPQFGGEEKLRVARWLLDAGEKIPEDVLVEASAVAIAAGDPRLALTLARRAAAVSEATHASLLVARGHIALGDFVAAAAVLDGLGPPFESRDDAVEYLEAQIAVLRWGLHRYDDLRELLAQARQWWTDPDWQQQVGLLKLVADGTAPPASALVLTGQLIADPKLDEEVRRRAGAVHIGHLFRSGQVREAAAFARPLLPRLPLRDIYDEIVCILWPACMIESGDDWDELDRWATRTFAEAIDAGDHSAAARCALPLGGLRMQQGRFADARRWLAEAELQLERYSGQGLLLMTRALQVGVAQMTGSLGEAGLALEGCRTLISDSEPFANERFFLAQAEAWAALATGDDGQAQETLLAAARELSDMPPYGVRLSYHAFVWGAPSARVAPHLREHASRCPTRLAAAYVAHVDAHAARDGAALAAAASELEAIGAIPVAAIAAAHAATAFARQGRADSARRAATHSQALSARCDGGPRPVIEGVEPSEVVLTRRERQLVALAAQGLTNAEIADQLVVSIRTVESHLYRAMNKLGVGHRRELPML